MMGSEISAERGTFPVLLALVLVLKKVLGTKRTLSLCHYSMSGCGYLLVSLGKWTVDWWLHWIG